MWPAYLVLLCIIAALFVARVRDADELRALRNALYVRDRLPTCGAVVLPRSVGEPAAQRKNPDHRWS